MRSVKIWYGLSNKSGLEFGRYLSDHDIPIWIRYVLVPGITDDKKDLLDLKNYIDSLKTVEKIEILPFHQMGEHKWEQYGDSYELKNVPDATVMDIDRTKKMLGI